MINIILDGDCAIISERVVSSNTDTVFVPSALIADDLVPSPEISLKVKVLNYFRSLALSVDDSG